MAEKKYYRDLILTHEDNIRKSWSIIKVLSTGTTLQNARQNLNWMMAMLLRIKKIISEKFNDYFVNVDHTLAQSISRIEKAPINSMGDSKMQSLYLKPVTSEEMSNILLSLKISATGWEEIPVKFLKLSNCYIVQPLTFISNLSLFQGVFPDKMKLANAIPLHTSDDPMYFNHYRPVSLLCILSKVFEKIMYRRLIAGVSWKRSNLIQKPIWIQKKHSTYMALMILVDKITKSLENGEFAIGIFLRLFEGVWYCKSWYFTSKVTSLWYSRYSVCVVQKLP